MVSMRTASANPAVAELLRLMQDGFDPPRDRGWSHGLLENLASVPEDRWRAVVAPGSRSVEAIALHVGACKVMYDDYAFGAGTLTWEDSAVQPWAEGEASMAGTLEWLRQAQERVVAHVSVLTDADLDQPRRANWGESEPTRWLIQALITHDVYHAGEINHLRSLLDGDDRWAHERLEEG